MSDPSQPKQTPVSQPSLLSHPASYQSQIYAAGMLHSLPPTITKDPNGLEAQAKTKLSSKSFAYVAGGAGERATMDANRLSFRTWKLVPRMLRPSGPGQRNIKTTLFGREMHSPVIMAPVGVQGIFHPSGEEGSARAAAKVGVPYVMSTAASRTIEQVALASGEGERWFQLYWPKDDEVTLSLLDRAQRNGFRVLVVTLDTWALAWRPWDLDEGYVPFMTGTGNEVGFSDPVFRRLLKEREGIEDPKDDIVRASLAWQREAFSGEAHGWEHVKLLVDNWDGPVVLKGIQHPDDAKKAAEMGVKGIIVSNHGGRQLDGAVGSLEMLPEVVDALEGTEVEVLFDSGIRTGVDIIKALALGAKGVLIGRPYVYGLGINGEKGAEDVMRGLLADLDQSMALAGINNIGELGRHWLRKSNLPGDRHSSN